MVYSLNRKKYLELYKTYFLIRNLELEISRKYKQNKMRCPTHLSVGQELVPSALSVIWKKNDYAVSTHRGHAHFLAKGGNPNKMIAEIYGKKTGTSKGKGGSMHLIDLSVNFMGTSAIVGNSIPVGVGLGLSSQLKRKKSISYVFLGDGATEEGVFYESLNFAAVKSLPVIFICENNLYSVYSSLSVRQPKNRKIYKLAKSIGIQSSLCDGYNLFKILKNLKFATDYVKKQKKPYFLEFTNYRWFEHCGPNFDNDLGYRKNSEYLKFKKKDPIEKIRHDLIKIYGKKRIIKEELQILNKIKKSFRFAEESDFPKISERYKGIYA